MAAVCALKAETEQEPANTFRGRGALAHPERVNAHIRILHLTNNSIEHVIWSLKSGEGEADTRM